MYIYILYIYIYHVYTYMYVYMSRVRGGERDGKDHGGKKIKGFGDGLEGGKHSLFMPLGGGRGRRGRTAGEIGGHLCKSGPIDQF